MIQLRLYRNIIATKYHARSFVLRISLSLLLRIEVIMKDTVTNGEIRHVDGSSCKKSDCAVESTKPRPREFITV